MAPEKSVLVKRKQRDEPLDVLYIDAAPHPTTSARKRRQVAFRRVSPTDTPASLPSPPARASPPEDAVPPKDSLHPNPQHVSPKKHGTFRGRSPRQPLAPRRFHMLQERVSASVLHRSSAAGTKRTDAAVRSDDARPGDGAARQLVVFEEQRAKKPRSVPPSGAPPPAEPVRKRPQAGPSERTWRQANWSNRSRSREATPLMEGGGDEPKLTEAEAARMRLAIELQAFSMEETQRDEQRKAEAAAAAGFMDVDGTTHSDDDSEAYVYDRYVRCSTPEQDENFESPGKPDARQMGYLVIEKENEEAWQKYLDELEDNADEESDPDALEDDEDSNAEDYYTHDYPEEEDRFSLSGRSDSSRGSFGGARRRHQREDDDDGDYDLNDPAFDVGFDDDLHGPEMGR